MGGRILSEQQTCATYFYTKHVYAILYFMKSKLGMASTAPISPSNKGHSAVLCFGEVLADRFPDREVLGGAPFNVARHLHGLGGRSGPVPVLVTRVGRDPLGQRVLSAMTGAGLPIDGVQQDFLRDTGVVKVGLDESGQPSFEIPPDQAWDHIHPDIARLVGLAWRPGRVYFGTLAQRSASRQALRYLLISSQAEGFLDLNLRDPWVRDDILRGSLGLARTVKLNEQELSRLAALLHLPGHDFRERGRALLETFRSRRLLVTRGGNGAWLLDAEAGELEAAGANAAVEVVDSVGAGDAFAAVFLLGLHLDWPLQDTLDRAHRFAGAVCGLRGAVPDDASFYAPFQAEWDLVPDTTPEVSP